MTTTTAEPSGDTAQGTDRRSVTLLFIGLMITMLLASLNQTVLSTALPTIVGELHGVDQMTWVITAYILASTIVMPVYGKISDLLGRKPVLLSAIAIFLAGSVVGALAGNISWLIFGRVLQGLGGGGLMILSQAAIADVVPARERGRYMGFMGAVFAVSSVAGPLLGGWLTEGPGWRWAFWGNLPLGALAIAATIAFLKLPKVEQTIKPRMDYLGMALIAGATTALVLVCTWGGHTYPWLSSQIITLGVAAVVLAIAFVAVEKRAENPIMPMGLFADRNFNLTTVANLMIGVAMFGALGYMPTYIQMVTGVSATVAGLLMIPMMGGLLITSIVSGQAVSRTGRYKIFPIVGSFVMGLGLVFIATMHITTPTWLMCVYLAVFGVGIGLSMQILTLIVQNSFPTSMVGTATAANNYFRQVGATLGSAIVGSIFASRLATLLTERLGGSGAGDASGRNGLTPAAVNALPDAIRIPVIESYNEALLPIFLFFVPLAAIALVVLLFVKEKPLATTVDTPPVAAAEAVALPTAEVALDEPATSTPDRREPVGAGGTRTR
ncbi:MDR family MFS transporter [Gordonia hydrophobica]|uniref:MDR family MFS transporter n=1 Tax=Gordonia hydrophobica TaxID=40516 RepID=A0ABZ2TYB1_9ACTN|nr:MDR family MFS transporter [Gordonia hydrophobica]MBM7367000.1 EmrB/QacA subfamily drug resistance transporter [Gordonia hydrophobica]